MMKNTRIFAIKSVLFALAFELTIPSLGFAARSSAPPIQCSSIPALVMAFLRTHVSNPSGGESLEKKAAEQFVQRIDPSKAVLLQSDVDNLKAMVLRFFKKSREPNCEEINGVKQLLLERTNSQLSFAKEILVDSYKLDENAEIILDPEKRQFAKDEKEANSRQLASIHFQISNYLMTDLKLAEARKQLIHRYELNLKRIGELSESDLYDYLVNSYAAALDPHSSYLSPEALEEFQMNMRLSLEGIGASLSSEDGYTVIQELISGGAAARSKLLQPKDKIIAVGQGTHGTMENVIDMDLRDVVKMIRGKAGSTVRLSILRMGKDLERFNISLVRSKVNLEDEAAKVEYYERKVGVKTLKIARLELPSFYGDNTLKERSCSRDVAKILEEVKKRKVDGLVLDLSTNGGGRLEEAVRIAGFFIKKGNIVATKDSRQEVQVLEDEDSRVLYDGPLVVMTNRLSASASEIVAGALQDYGRAVIVGGDHTYGKGSVQMVLDLQNNFGAIKVTSGLFYIPVGNSTQHRGVSSDIEIPSVFSSDDIGERFLDNSLKPDAIPNFLSRGAYGSLGQQMINNKVENFKRVTAIAAAIGSEDWIPVTKSEISVLKQNSAKRVETNKDFAQVKKEIKEINERKGVVRLSDLRKKDAEQKKKDGGKKKAAKEIAREKALPNINEAVNVVADLISLRTSTITQASENK